MVYSSGKVHRLFPESEPYEREYSMNFQDNLNVLKEIISPKEYHRCQGITYKPSEPAEYGYSHRKKLI